ncbi:MAG: hypothetical protein H7252_02775 [Cytophaga sp.]|nr:hypothetical protein [Undibacterium sp.]
MSLITIKKFATALCLVTFLVSAAHTSVAQEAQLTPTALVTPDAPNTQETSWWNQAKTKTLDIYDNGTTSLMLSGYARHGRNTYTAQRIAELNEKAWGLGFTKAIRDKKDNEESIYGLAISDSHFKPQFMVGYAYQWMQPLADRYEAGIGATAIIFSRTDYFSGLPFPGVVPVGSVGTRSTKLMAAYIPRFSRNKGNGDVLLMFVRVDLN